MQKNAAELVSRIQISKLLGMDEGAFVVFAFAALFNSELNQE